MLVVTVVATVTTDGLEPGLGLAGWVSHLESLKWWARSVRLD